MTRLMINEIPKTRAEFIKKWNDDHIFRARAQYTGFEVYFNSIVRMPHGTIAGANVKQPLHYLTNR